MIPPLKDTITIIRARARRLTKLIRADGKIDDYDSVRAVDLFTRRINDLPALERLLSHLLDRPDCAIVRGEVIDPTWTRRVRRLVHPCPKTGEAPTLRAASHSWLALDLDAADRPAELDPADLPACAGEAVSRPAAA